VSVPEFAAAWGEIFELNAPMADLVGLLADRGHRLVLGSNTNPMHARQIRRQFAPLLARFHHLVLSFELGAMKPSAAFFEACVTAAERPASLCVFIDDVPENVAGARRAGLSAVLYQEPAQLGADLAALGLDLSPLLPLTVASPLGSSG
jgi:putative hydrolase of the HAD superfamily